MGTFKISQLGYVAAYTVIVNATSSSGSSLLVQGKMQATAGADGPFALNCSSPANYDLSGLAQAARETGVTRG